MSKIDIVIPLGSGSKDENIELRFALRSFEKNFKDLGNVYIVTDRLPEWCSDDVKHIFGLDLLKKNKDGNMIRKMLLACDHKDVSDIFIRSSDDQLLLKELSIGEWKIYNIGDLSKKKYDETNKWHHKLQNSLNKLKSEGKPTINYEAHIPMPVNKKAFKEIMNQYDYDVEGEGYTINSLYFNNIDVPKSYKATTEKITFEEEHTLACDEIIAKMGDKIFCGYNDKGLTEEFKKALFKMFPNKSRFEKEDLLHEYNTKEIPRATLEAIVARETKNGKNALLEARTLLLEQINRYEAIRKTIQKPVSSDKYVILAGKIIAMVEENLSIKDLTEYNKS